MSVQLFANNRQAYDAVTAMLHKASKAAVIHPTGTGKSFIAFKWIEAHAGERFVWLSPSEYIYHTQIENVTRTAPDFPVESITFLTYARLMMMTDEEIAALAPFGIILDEFHRWGAKCWGGGVARLLAAYPGAQLLGLPATKIRYLDGQRDTAEELFAGCVASEMTLGEAVVRGILPAPTYVTTIYQIQRELEGLQKRIEAVGPAALRRDSQRQAREGKFQYRQLTQEQIRRLDAIGMNWGRSREERWNAFYSAARSYYSKNGNLDVSPKYKTPDGACLSMWVYDQRRNWRDGKLSDPERYNRLAAIGMFESRSGS